LGAGLIEFHVFATGNIGGSDDELNFSLC